MLQLYVWELRVIVPLAREVRRPYLSRGTAVLVRPVRGRSNFGALRRRTATFACTNHTPEELYGRAKFSIAIQYTTAVVNLVRNF